MSAAVGLALAIGLVWWEQEHNWSVRDLGPVAVGFAVILLGMIMFQGIRHTGGSWAGACLAFGASILVAWVLGFDWPVASEVIQTLVVVALIVGIVAFLIHRHRWVPQAYFAPASIGPGPSDVRHDMRDLYEDRGVGERIRKSLFGLSEEAELVVEHPEEIRNILLQLRRLLPAEDWLTQRLSRLRERAHHFQRGHAARLKELKHLMPNLTPAARKRASQELKARYVELHLDKRLERLDLAVAENERRIQMLTREAEEAAARCDHRRLAELLEEAEKLQRHNEKLFAIINRTEQKFEKFVQDLARDLSRGGER